MLVDVAEWLVTSHFQDPGELHSKKTPLFYASGYGNLKIAQLLIKHGADVNAQCTARWRVETVHLVTESGADVNARAFRDQTPLYLTAEEGHLEVVRVLLENGADGRMQTDKAHAGVG
ncbi:ankyrin repeat-containing domain protein [Lactarius psammicola]|nr:ankyrin repeat-containing domain protein [Lactarius psammicola]